MNRKYFITYLWTFTWDIIVWLIVMMTWFFFGTKLHWQNGLWCELKRGSVVSRIWKCSGVTLGHGGIYNYGCSGGDGVDTKTERHELIHVEQYEVSMLVSFVAGNFIFWSDVSLASLTIGSMFWTLGWGIVYGASMLQAWLRGENYYRGNIMEESAYSQAEE